jgi:hypothetical protein
LVLAAVTAVLAYILWAPLHRSLVAFLALIILVPTVLVFPNGMTSAITVPRLGAVALAFRLFICIRRREVSPAALRPTAVHAAFMLFLAVMVVTGVLLAAPATSTTGAMNRWFGMLEQFLVFALVLAVARTYRDTTPLARNIAALIGVSALIAIGERVTGVSWARLVLENIPGLRAVLGAIPLEERSGGLRVRAASEFALEFAWIGAMVLPLVAAVASRTRRWRLRAVPVLLALAIYWSNSRSAFAGIILGVAVVAFASRDRRASRLALAGLAAAALLYVAAPSLREPFTGATQTGSTKIREQRLPEITEIVEKTPYHGLGFEGLIPLGFPTTDASYLLAYAESGVVGLATLIALLIVVLIYCACGLRGPPSWNRLLAAAVVGGLIAAVLGGGAFDLWTVGGSGDLFWVLAALGVLVAERSGGAPELRVSARRLAFAPLGLIVGVVLRAAIPSHVAVTTQFDALPLPRVVYSPDSSVFTGGILLNTFCSRADQVHLPPKTSLDCFDPHTAPGYGILRVDAGDVSTARRATARVVHALETDLRGTYFHPSETLVGKPTWARTAPASVGTGVLFLALTCPVPRRRRRPVTDAGPATRELVPLPT